MFVYTWDYVGLNDKFSTWRDMRTMPKTDVREVSNTICESVAVISEKYVKWKEAFEHERLRVHCSQSLNAEWSTDALRSPLTDGVEDTKNLAFLQETVKKHMESTPAQTVEECRHGSVDITSAAAAAWGKTRTLFRESHFGQFYSLFQAYQMMLRHVNISGVTYDYVIRARPDVLFGHVRVHGLEHNVLHSPWKKRYSKEAYSYINDRFFVADVITMGKLVEIGRPFLAFQMYYNSSLSQYALGQNPESFYMLQIQRAKIKYLRHKMWKSVMHKRNLDWVKNLPPDRPAKTTSEIESVSEAFGHRLAVPLDYDFINKTLPMISPPAAKTYSLQNIDNKTSMASLVRDSTPALTPLNVSRATKRRVQKLKIVLRKP
ncbi:hypothetical protein CYMTET_15711 [Cymbomonas tetramitiformis]|uniref:Uncharacterized protein n=1 Tax=Cymbomonas tetramitiformis TaxID=36881 RepID=A0AAE0GDU5_9CHLO|nr:hypothetical protein CYMTET_15711 [Cymbomonas tetramitiformis]